MNRIFYILIFSIFSSLTIFSSCQEKMICAAYQSAFILDDQKQQLAFGPMINDSTPRIYNQYYAANKNGVGPRHGYQQQSNSVKVLAMEYQYRDRRFDTARVVAVVDTSSLAEIDYSLIGNGLADSLAGPEVNPDWDMADDEIYEEDDEWSNTKRFNYNVDMVKYMEIVGNDVMLWQYERRELGIQKAQEPSFIKALWISIVDFFKNMGKGSSDKETDPAEEGLDANAEAEEVENQDANTEEDIDSDDDF